MLPERLVYMANQIAAVFTTQDASEAAALTADHVRKFWDPRMRREITAVLHEGGAGLSAVARQAVESLDAKDGGAG